MHSSYHPVPFVVKLPTQKGLLLAQMPLHYLLDAPTCYRNFVDYHDSFKHDNTKLR